MATARALITRSLGLGHIIDSGETPTAAEMADSLDALNDMLDSFSIPGLYLYAQKEEELSWPASTQSRTIGASGNFDTTRPTEISESTFIRIFTNQDYRLKMLKNRAAYSGIVLKGSSSDIPEYLYYEPSYPLGTLFIWPVPSSTLAVFLHSPEQLSQLATLDTEVDVPVGYREMIAYNLAIRLAALFGVAVPPEVATIARGSANSVKRLNVKEPLAELEPAYLGGSRYNINTDRQ
jgi:hypothetical protein